MTASKLRQTYSSAASLNSDTELGATAVSSEHTLRAFTNILVSKAHRCDVIKRTITTDEPLTNLRQAVKHQLISHGHDIHDMIQEFVQCKQIVEILTRNLVKDLLASISIQMANNELEKMGLDIRQIYMDWC